jgi:hypothetical protein
MKIYGHTVSTPVSHSDWNETNERMSSYINNKPSIKKGEGDYSTVRNEASEALGRGSDASGYGTKTEGDYSHVGGVNSQIATGGYASRVDGYNNKTSAKYSNVDGAENENHAECADISGYKNYAAEESDSVHIEGSYNYAGMASYNAHIEGTRNTADMSSPNAHIEGAENQAMAAPNAHIEGSYNTAEASGAHVEGSGNAAGIGAAFAHVEGSNNQAMYEALCAHIEGTNNSASGKYAHVQGSNNTANAHSSSASGFNNEVAVGAGYSSVSGSFNKAIGWNQNVRGKWCDPKVAAEIVGGGTSESDRRNIYELDWQGNAMFAGDVTVRGAKTLATLDEVKDAASKAVAKVVGSAPETLNTLEELGKALKNDENFATTITNELTEIRQNYVSNKPTDIDWTYVGEDGVTLQNGVYVIGVDASAPEDAIRFTYSAVVWVFDEFYTGLVNQYYLYTRDIYDSSSGQHVKKEVYVWVDGDRKKVTVKSPIGGTYSFKYKLLFPLQ